MNPPWEPDPWCQYLPDLHRVLADPTARTGLPDHFVGLDHPQAYAWWESLRYLFRSLLGWRNLPAGLAWWYAAGQPTVDDPVLQLIQQRWNSRRELDYFAAREWKTGGFTGVDESPGPIPKIPYEPKPGWWKAFEARGSLGFPDPCHGGYNPLHLGHSDSAGLLPSLDSCFGFHDPAKRSATVIVSGFNSWRTELETFGTSLPALPDPQRSWHVGVFERRTGFLGLFRLSRATGIWFQGKHGIHMAGNPAG